MLPTRLPPKVGIIVLHWRGVEDTLRCIRSVCNSLFTSYLLVVVNNGSREDSALILTDHPDLEVLETGRNLGYTGGNNCGIRYALAHGCDYILLLNNDAIIAPEAVSELVAAAQFHPQAGFLGPVVYIREDPQRILTSGGVLVNGWMAVLDGLGQVGQTGSNGVVEKTFLSGCALFVSKQAIDRIGMLDEDFFAYQEDVEWCYRGSKAGFKVLLVPAAKAWHPDTRQRDEDSIFVTYYITRNSLIFAWKHKLGLLNWAHMLLNLARTLLSYSLRWDRKHKRGKRDATLWALVDFMRGKWNQSDRFGKLTGSI